MSSRWQAQYGNAAFLRRLYWLTCLLQIHQCIQVGPAVAELCHPDYFARGQVSAKLKPTWPLKGDDQRLAALAQRTAPLLPAKIQRALQVSRGRALGTSCPRHPSGLPPPAARPQGASRRRFRMSSGKGSLSRNTTLAEAAGHVRPLLGCAYQSSQCLHAGVVLSPGAGIRSHSKCRNSAAGHPPSPYSAAAARSILAAPSHLQCCRMRTQTDCTTWHRAFRSISLRHTPSHASSQPGRARRSTRAARLGAAACAALPFLRCQATLVPACCPVQVPLMSCSALKGLLDDPRRAADVTVVDVRLPQEVGPCAAATPHAPVACQRCSTLCEAERQIPLGPPAEHAPACTCLHPCDPCLCRWR